MMLLREATVVDADVISRLFAASWRVSYRGIIAQHYLDRLPDEYWVPTLRAWLMGGCYTATIAEDNGEPIGCIIYGRGRDEAWAEQGEILSLYVLPTAMRKGCGTQLLRSALKALRSEGYTGCYLWAIRGNRAADQFYRKQGFRRTTDAIDYKIGGETVTDVRYVLDN